MVKTFRLIAVLSITLFSTPLFAGIQNPGCDKLQEWAAGYNSRDHWQVAPSIKFPNIAKDQILIPLFGQSIMDWSRDDFSEMNLWMNRCRKEASKRRDQTAAQTLNKARGAMANLHRFVNQIKQARGKVTPAINELLSAPDSQHLIAAITMAEEALQGANVRRGIRSLPQDLQQHILTMVNSLRYLPQNDVEEFAARIAERKDILQKKIGAEQGNAIAELEAAKKELAALPLSKKSLPVLDRLQKLPALKYVDPVQAQAFRRAVQSKRSNVAWAQKEEKKLAGNKMVANAIEELNQFEVETPGDLGRLYELGRNLKKQLQSQGVIEIPTRFGISLKEARHKRLEEAAKAQLPAFRKALLTIPSNQLRTAVADITGIKEDLPVLRPYLAEVYKRLQDIAPRQASRRATHAPDHSATDKTQKSDALQTQNTKANQTLDDSASDKTQTADTMQAQISALPPPSLAPASEILGTRIEGVYLGMTADNAVATLQEKGYRVERRGTSERWLGGTAKYFLESIMMRKGEVEPFPGGTMTKEEANAYKTRIAIDAVHSRSIQLNAYKGRVGMIILTGKSFDDTATVKAYVLEKLGAAHDERGVAGMWWNLKYLQDPKKQSLSDTQLQISIKKSHYTDEIKQENVPYTQIMYSAWICRVLPKCMH